MPESLHPSTPAELGALIADALQTGGKLRVRGGGSKDSCGAPTPAVPVLDMRGFAGVSDYDPPELVLSAGAGTPLDEIQALVASEGQMLAFDPFDHGRLFGNAHGRATIGGIVAAGVSGSRRLSGGAARDHLLGFEAVSGSGKAFKAGAKVVKNVTGFDLSKLMAGSWGRLVALTSVTLKVVPRPEASRTLCVCGLDPAGAIRVMARAVGSPAGVVAAAHLPDSQNGAATLFRIDGFPEALDARTETLRARVGDRSVLELQSEADSVALWNQVRDATPLPADRPLWRLVVAPGKAAALLQTFDDAKYLLDWAGGLVWLASHAGALAIRSAAVAAGGHAMLVRADATQRAATAALHPPAPGVARLEASIREAFDPGGVFDTGRF